METIRVDCGRCLAAGPACADCVVTLLLGANDDAPELTPAEQQALANLAAGGLVPPLRLVSDNPPAPLVAENPSQQRFRGASWAG